MMVEKNQERRREFLKLVGECLTDKEIGERLGISRSTVAFYKAQFYREHGWYGAGARYRLIRFALTGKDGNG